MVPIDYEYFVCTEADVIEWAHAIRQRDEEAQDRCEERMPEMVGLAAVTPRDIEGLCCAARGENLNEAMTFRVVSAEDPARSWVIGFEPRLCKMLSMLQVDDALVEAWRRAMRVASGEVAPEEALTEGAAQAIVDLFALAATRKWWRVFACRY